MRLYVLQNASTGWYYGHYEITTKEVHKAAFAVERSVLEEIQRAHHLDSCVIMAVDITPPEGPRYQVVYE